MRKRIRKKRARKSNEAEGLDLRDVAAPLRTPGVTGLDRQGGIVNDEWHVKLKGKRGLKQFREMHDNDPIIGSFNMVLQSTIPEAPIEVEQASDSPLALAARDHVESCFYDMSMTPSEVWSDVLSMVWAGYSMHGICYKIRRGDSAAPEFRSMHNDGRVGWRKLPIRAQMTIEEWIFQEDGGVDGAIQMAPPNYKRVELPMQQHLLFRTTSNKGNPEGRSLYRNAWRTWRFLKTIQELEAIGIERDMAGLLTFLLPVDYLVSGATDAQKQTVEDFRKLGERVRRGEHECLVFPTAEDDQGKTGFEAKLMQSGGRRPMDTDGVIKRLESRIALSFLGEGALLGMQGDVGSWALASNKTKMLGFVISGLMRKIEAVMNRFAIPRLMKANGWPQQVAPTMRLGDIESDVSTDLANVLATYVNAGILTPDADTEDYVRLKLNLPRDTEISQMQAGDALGAAEERTEEEDAAASDVAAQVAVPIDEQAGSPTSVMGLEQAAKTSGRSCRRILDAIMAKRLPASMVDGKWVISGEALTKAMKGDML